MGWIGLLPVAHPLQIENERKHGMDSINNRERLHSSLINVMFLFATAEFQGGSTLNRAFPPDGFKVLAYS